MPIPLRDVVSINEEVLPLTTLREYKAGANLDGYQGFVLRGIFGKADVKNKNNRVYSKKLWKNVVQSESLQQRIRNRQVLGELSHPDYTEPSLKEAAIIITSLQLDEATGDVIGEAIPAVGTPNGDLLVALLKLGVRPAVSSRGVGDVVNRNGVDYVLEDTYNYITHDLTLDPSVGTAWPSVFYKESVQEFRSDVTSILERYSGKLTESDRKVYNSLLESVQKHSNLKEAMQDFCSCNFPEKSSSCGCRKETTQVNKEKVMDENVKLKELIEKVGSLTQEKVELSNRIASITNENTDLKKKVAEGELFKARYEKTVGLVEDLTNRLNTEKQRAAKLQKESENAKTSLKKATEVIQETARRYRVLRDSHEELLAKRYPALYEKALSIIKEIRKRFIDQKRRLEAAEKKLRASTEVALAIQNKIKQEKIDKFLESELKPFGGREKFSKLLESVSTEEDAKKRVEAIRDMVKAGTFRASYVPNFGGESAKKLEESKKENNSSPIDHPFFTGQKKSIADLVSQV
jgi:hypothetical protein